VWINELDRRWIIHITEAHKRRVRIRFQVDFFAHGAHALE
jgi:hypothetical protein